MSTPILKKSAAIILVVIISLLILPAGQAPAKKAAALPAEPPLSDSEPLAESAATEHIPYEIGINNPPGSATGSTASSTACANAAVNAPTAEEPPTVKTIDKQGYTVWTVEYPDSEPSGWADWCIPISMLYSIDLGEQDPTMLEDATLQWVFSGHRLLQDMKMGGGGVTQAGRWR